MLSPKPRFQRALAKARKVSRGGHLLLAVFSLIVGAGVGGAVIGLREAIALFQSVGYGVELERLYLVLEQTPAWRIVLIPALGGLIVGLLARYLTPKGRPENVSDVIEASVMRGGAMSSRAGLAAALVSAVSIGSGASVGREGPAVHLGASLAGWLTRRLRLPPSMGRTLLGCGVASAVAASFNAPIAGALFASEVIVGNYALKAFAPIMISSVAGTAVSRAWFGDYPAFTFGENILASYWELPGFLILGLACGVGAIIFMRAIEISAGAAKRIPGPDYIKPAVAGFMTGVIALWFPHVMGVGYGLTEAAVAVEFAFWTFVALGLAKGLASALCLGFGFAGGVFSPALVLGALMGVSYGIVATAVFPDLSSGPAAYTLVGMGAFAAAVLGAPISTTLIIFEMTGDYALTLGVMTAVVAATEVTHHGYGRSFFVRQLKRRGLDLKAEFEAEALHAITVGEVMETSTPAVNAGAGLAAVRAQLVNSPWSELFVTDDDGRFCGVITLADLREKAFDPAADENTCAADVIRSDPPMLTAADDLDAALALMRRTGEDHIAVVNNHESMIFSGCVHQRDVLTAYNKALLKTRHEEHGDDG
ncbi:MAG: chloride channel protein [Rhodospirillales bacterium]